MNKSGQKSRLSWKMPDKKIRKHYLNLHKSSKPDNRKSKNVDNNLKSKSKSMPKKSDSSQNCSLKKWNKYLSQTPFLKKGKNRNTCKNKNKPIKGNDSFNNDKGFKPKKKEDRNNSRKKSAEKFGKVMKNNKWNTKWRC